MRANIPTHIYTCKSDGLFLGELGVLIELDAIVELFGVIGRVKYVLEGKLMPYIMMFDRISVIITVQRSE